MSETFKNDHGEIPAGTEVYFDVENPNMWIGPTSGILIKSGDGWSIDLGKSGIVHIGGYLEAYTNSVRPVRPARAALLPHQEGEAKP